MTLAAENVMEEPPSLEAQWVAALLGGGPKCFPLTLSAPTYVLYTQPINTHTVTSQSVALLWF